MVWSELRRRLRSRNPPPQKKELRESASSSSSHPQRRKGQRRKKEQLPPSSKRKFPAPPLTSIPTHPPWMPSVSPGTAGGPEVPNLLRIPPSGLRTPREKNRTDGEGRVCRLSSPPPPLQAAFSHSRGRLPPSSALVGRRISEGAEHNRRALLHLLLPKEYCISASQGSLGGQY